jgi:hypothetical protein
MVGSSNGGALREIHLCTMEVGFYGRARMRLDLGIALQPLTFAAAYRPAAAPPIYSRFCALAADTAADYARRNRTGIAVPGAIPAAP